MIGKEGNGKKYMIKEIGYTIDKIKPEFLKLLPVLLPFIARKMLIIIKMGPIYHKKITNNGKRSKIKPLTIYPATTISTNILLRFLIVLFNIEDQFN